MQGWTNVNALGEVADARGISYTAANTPVQSFAILARQQFVKKNGDIFEDKVYISCTWWGHMAEKTPLQEGDIVLVKGQFRYRGWEDKDGNRKGKNEVNVMTLVKIGNAAPKPGQGERETQQVWETLPPRQPQPSRLPQDDIHSGATSDTNGDDDIPF